MNNQDDNHHIRDDGRNNSDYHWSVVDITTSFMVIAKANFQGSDI